MNSPQRHRIERVIFRIIFAFYAAAVAAEVFPEKREGPPLVPESIIISQGDAALGEEAALPFEPLRPVAVYAFVKRVAMAAMRYYRQFDRGD